MPQETHWTDWIFGPVITILEAVGVPPAIASDISIGVTIMVAAAMVTAVQLAIRWLLGTPRRIDPSTRTRLKGWTLFRSIDQDPRDGPGDGTGEGGGGWD
jgi:hypothetical protein